MISTLALNTFWAIALGIASYGLGNLLLRSVRNEKISLAEQISLACAVGIGAMSFLLLGLSKLGFYQPRTIAILFAVIAVASLYPFGRLLQSIRAGLKLNSDWRQDVWLGIPPALLIGVEFVRSWLPNTENDAYHYELPLIWLRHGAMHDTGATLYDGFTHAIHLLYGAGLAMGGDAAANKFAWLAFIVCLVGCVGLSHAAGWPRRVGLYAACALGAIHSLAAEASGGLVDIHVLMFTVAAGILGFRWLRGHGIWNILIFGALLGLLGGTKQNGWLAAGSLLFAFTGAAIVGSGARRGLGALLWVTMAFLATGVPWLYWSYQVTGNPLYPAFNSFFGAAGHGLGWGDEATQRGLERNLLTYLTYPWRLSMDFRLLRDSWAFGIGPAMIAFAPLAVFYRRRGSAMLASALFIGAFLSGMYVLAPHMVRYLFPVFAFSALLAGNAAYTLHLRMGRLGRSAIAAILVGPVLLAAAMETARLAPHDARQYLVGSISASEYRDRHHNYAGHALITEANSLLPADANVLLIGVKGLGLEREYADASRVSTVTMSNSDLSKTTVLETVRREGISHVIVQMAPRTLALAALAQTPVGRWQELQTNIVTPPGYSVAEIQTTIDEACDDPDTALSAYNRMFFPRAGGAMLLALSEHLRVVHASDQVERGFIYEVRIAHPGGDDR